MIEAVRKLDVKYNGKIVGYLAEYNDGRIGFQYDKEWQESGFSISPFSLPLSNDVFVSEKTIFGGLFGVFWDSLPDGWGELLVRRMLSRKGINPDKLSVLQRLSIVAKNGLGALEYEPSASFENKFVDVDLDQLAEETKKILNDETDGTNLDTIYHLGGSSGGARPKAHISLDGEEWIVKFPCLIDPVNIGEQEYNANKTAKECGINVNEFKLFESGICTGYFGAKRFDRKNGKKVHMISLAGMLETTHRLPNLDYNHLFQVINAISADSGDLYEAFRRMCFNVLYQNRDDHGKNFAFLYDEELKGYRLSPAYDITSTPNKFEHEMAVGGNGKPTEEDLLSVASNFKLSLDECQKIIEQIKQTIKE